MFHLENPSLVISWILWFITVIDLKQSYIYHYFLLFTFHCRTHEYFNGVDMKGGAGDSFFTIDLLLMVSQACTQNFRTIAPFLLVEERKKERS